MVYNFYRLTATLNLCPINLKLLVHVLLLYGYCSCDFEINQKKIKGGCQSGRKVVPHDFKSDSPLVLHTKCNMIQDIHEKFVYVWNEYTFHFGSELLNLKSISSLSAGLQSIPSVIQ